jgi:tetrahedral aminopeptidase
MESGPYEFFRSLLETPRPSGYEASVQQRIRTYARPFAESIHTDPHGNVICARNAAAPLRLMLAGHCDQIGLLVTHIDEQGFLRVQPIGGWDPQQLIGQRLMVWTDHGPLPGVMARKPIHLLKPEEKEKAVKLEELWIDLGVQDQAEAKSLVRIGDCVTLALGIQAMRNGLANAPGMDNACGAWVVMEALRRAAQGPLDCAVLAVSTVQEEIGLRGAQTSAHGIDPHVAIAVDVTHATDCPTIEKNTLGEIRLGKGPVIFRGPNMNHGVTARLMEVAERHGIPYQVAAIGRATPNDANVLQITRAGVATGLVSIPNRYMHSAVETISLEDIDHAAQLLAEFARSLSVTDHFIPTGPELTAAPDQTGDSVG